MKSPRGMPERDFGGNSAGVNVIPKGRIFVDMGSAIIGDAVAGLVQSFGYQSCTRQPAGGDVDVIIVDSSTIDKKRLDLPSKSKVILMETDAHQKNVAVPILYQKVHGIISCTMDSAKFRKALEAITGGQFWIDSPSVKSFLLSAGLVSSKGELLGFTPQEKRIVEHICRGDTNREIAEKLHLSIHTIKTHLRSIMRKAGAINRSHLASLVTQFSGEDKRDVEPL